MPRFSMIDSIARQKNKIGRNYSIDYCELILVSMAIIGRLVLDIYEN